MLYLQLNQLISTPFSLVFTILVINNAVNFQSAARADFAYNPETAYEFVKLSNVAYSHDISTYLQIVLPDYELVGKAEKHCQFESNCAAFVAKRVNATFESVDKTQDVVAVSFRGTNNPLQLMDEIINVLIPRKTASIGGLVQPFFHEGYELLWDDLMKMVNASIQDMEDPKLYVTGHSLGAAMAALFASEVARRQYFPTSHIYVITFGEPRVGNPTWAMNYDKLVPQTWRVVHHRDIVPHIPPCQLVPWRATCATRTPYYYHHGTEVFYANENMTIHSPYTICTGEPKNEDNNCSDGLIVQHKCIDLIPCVNDHLQYFGRDLAFWDIPWWE